MPSSARSASSSRKDFVLEFDGRTRLGFGDDHFEFEEGVGDFLLDATVQLKLMATDGKMREADTENAETILRNKSLADEYRPSN